MAEREHLIDRRGSNLSYEADYAAWLASQVLLMKAGRWSEIDKVNLIDEVESLGRSDFRSFVSAIRVVLVHMLKWDFQEDHRTRSWADSIEGHREQVLKELKDSPSYKARVEEALTEAYRRARFRAAQETKIPIRLFPQECPYEWEEILSRPHELSGPQNSRWPDNQQ